MILERKKNKTKSLEKKTGKAVSGQLGHKGTALAMSEKPDAIIRFPAAKYNFLNLKFNILSC